MQRESMQYDVVVVGAGPAGLGCAIRLKQLAADAGKEVNVCVLEKGSEVGAHILSGAVIDPRALNELLPDWKERGAPLETPVTADSFFFLTGERSAVALPQFLVPSSMHNAGNYIVSLGNVCRWLAKQAEEQGVEIFPGYPAADVLYDDTGAVRGVVTGDMGISASGSQKPGFTAGMELHARWTVFAEGSRGHLGRRLMERFRLAEKCDPQHYAIGLKELWEVQAEKHTPGLVVHGAGWPLTGDASGGFFLYHAAARQVSVGLIVDLNYSNPYLNPFEEFQRLKHHPRVADVLRGGRRLAYGARAITKGGLNSLPRLGMPGALLIGCEAGTLNFSKIKGTHTAMKSGMLAAESILGELHGGAEAAPAAYETAFRNSWVHDELKRSRNFGPALHRFGTWLGGAFNYVDQTLLRGRLPLTLHDRSPDHATLRPAEECTAIAYPKADNELSFDRLSSVFVSGTNHEEDQPAHLTLKDASIPVDLNLKRYQAPEQRYCPAGVYEIVREAAGPRLQINAQNCVHCKTCDIKDPSQNIVWVTPEGGGGPNYPNM